jgi:hypothetical protein
MPEPRHLYSPVGFIEAVNNQVVSMNNSADPTITPKGAASPGKFT